MDDRPSGRRKLLVAAVSAAVLVIAGVAVAVVNRQSAGWIAVAAGAVIGAALLVAVLRGHTKQIAALTNLQESRTAQAARTAAEQRLSGAKTRVADLGLPADPATIRDLADHDDQARATAAQYADWENSNERTQAGLHHALEKLSCELGTRDVLVTRNPEEDYHHYIEDCSRRSVEAREADRQDGLESQLRDRRQAEQQAAEASARRTAAEQALRTAATASGLSSTNTAGLDGLVTTIEDWLRQREKEIGLHQQALADYAILQKMLNDGTLDDLKAEADRLGDAFTATAEEIDRAEIQGTRLGPDPVATLRELREAARNARDKVTQLRTTVRNQEGDIPSVAEAEENLVQKTDHVRRLERLSNILGTARTFLVQAQENVHRSIAPQLADAIAPHLGRITAGRYTEVTVDPEELQVKVRAPSGAWREAGRLSHGTAEQVYILLRAALAQYLVTTDESCSLIFDDPTAYADAPRTAAILRVLHHLSAERQIIVFSHDTQVLAWAQEALQGPRDGIIELPGLPVS
jgi:DNA repair exonuclease SbcCD ATPase subunit